MRAHPATRPGAVASVVATLALLFAVPAQAVGDPANGARVYDKRCGQCHGPDGDGKGAGWEFMLPRPRIFKDNSSYKFRTTVAAALPTDQDLFDIITIGIPGSSMPGFAVLPEQERWDLVAYLKSLSEDFEDEEYLEEAVVLEELVTLTPTPSTPEAIERGAALFKENKCNTCHGELGRGNGDAGMALKDDYMNPILPRNLTNPEIYRAGSTPEDIFRTITTGLNGSPMAAYRDSMSVEQRWDVVHFVRSLHPEAKEARDEVIQAMEVETLPTTGDDEAWDATPTARFATLPNIIDPPRLFWSSVEFVTVQALFNKEEVALRVQWDDRTESKGGNIGHRYPDREVSILQGTDHPDQFALQFPVKNDPDTRPYFLHGDSKRAVTLWHWRGDTGAFEEQVGKGFNAVSTQAEQSQTVTSSVTYDDGRYTMYLRRSLKTEDTRSDVQFEAGSFTPIAFSAWDGDRGEVGNRRSMTTWYWLYLRPPLPETVNTYPPFAFFLTLGLLLILISAVRRRVGAQEEEKSEA